MPLIQLIVLIILSDNTFSQNILILEEEPSPSHHLWLKNVIGVLVEKGYNITSLSADYEPPTNNSQLHYIHLEKVYDTLYGNSEESINLIELGAENPLRQLKSFYEFSLTTCRGALSSKGWQQLENYPDNFKFDLIIHDYPSGNCHLAFLTKFKYPPLISMTAFNDISLPKAIIHGSVLTPSISTHFMFKHVKSYTFLDRLDNFLIQLFDSFMRSNYLHPKMDYLLKNSFRIKKLPTINELRNKAQLVLLNYNPIVDAPEQLPPNIIGVGGLQIKTTKQLPNDLKIIADQAVNGLIVFSLGTNVPVHLFGKKILSDLLETFQRLPDYKFLCKLNLTGLPSLNISKNVIIRNWLPQNELLAHNNTKLFITHSGLLSVQEGIWHGVPMLGMPVFMDQFLNTDLLTIKGFGDKLLWSEFTIDKLHKKLIQLLEHNRSYHLNQIQQASQIFRDQKESPLERAIWWLEWVIRNPNGTTEMYGQQENHLNLLQLQSIDVLFVIFVILLTSLWTLKCLIVYFVKLFIVKKSKNQLNDKKLN